MAWELFVHSNEAFILELLTYLRHTIESYIFSKIGAFYTSDTSSKEKKSIMN